MREASTHGRGPVAHRGLAEGIDRECYLPFTADFAELQRSYQNISVYYTFEEWNRLVGLGEGLIVRTCWSGHSKRLQCSRIDHYEWAGSAWQHLLQWSTSEVQQHRGHIPACSGVQGQRACTKPHIWQRFRPRLASRSSRPVSGAQGAGVCSGRDISTDHAGLLPLTFVC
jgi:hypothetical protein